MAASTKTYRDGAGTTFTAREWDDGAAFSAVTVLGDGLGGMVPKAEDAAAVSGDVGIPILGVRRDSPASSAGTDGDYATLNLDATGNLYVTGSFAISAGATTIAKAEDVASANADVGVPAMAIQKATPADTAGTDGDYAMLQMSGGKLWAKASIDQTTPGTTDRVSVGGLTLIDVTLTLDTSAYASGDLLADTQVVASAVRLNDGKGILHSVLVVDEDDQGVAMDIYFLSANNTLGTENAAPSISDANARDILCRVSVATTDYSDLGGVRIADIHGLNRIIKGASSSTSIYVAVVNGTGTPTFTASGLKLRVGILQD